MRPAQPEAWEGLLGVAIPNLVGTRAGFVEGSFSREQAGMVS